MRQKKKYYLETGLYYEGHMGVDSIEEFDTLEEAEAEAAKCGWQEFASVYRGVVDLEKVSEWDQGERK